MKLSGAKSWIAGIAIALLGVGIARFPVGEAIAQYARLPLLLTGTVLVFFGLHIISKEIRKG